VNERSLDPQRTIDHEQANGQPETIDVNGAYQTALPTEPQTPAPPADTPVIPGYRILHEIARGSMGRVLAGIEDRLDREVAIKTLLTQADADRFITESKITAKLRFVQIFEQIAQAVGFVHSRGIIHRDLKPQNVMAIKLGEFNSVLSI
jgi:eukaryotic-like serine/threonine-protein kinase